MDDAIYGGRSLLDLYRFLRSLRLNGTCAEGLQQEVE